MREVTGSTPGLNFIRTKNTPGNIGPISMQNTALPRSANQSCFKLARRQLVAVCAVPTRHYFGFAPKINMIFQFNLNLFWLNQYMIITEKDK
jgi:hypothetical protein